MHSQRQNTRVGALLVRLLVLAVIVAAGFTAAAAGAAAAATSGAGSPLAGPVGPPALPPHGPDPAHWVHGVHPGTTGLSSSPNCPNTTSCATNWSGEISPAIATTGLSFSSVSASWTVPTVQPSVGHEYSSTWIGIDGAFPPSSSSPCLVNGSNACLIQTGTEQDYLGSSQYYAWWEVIDPATIAAGQQAEMPLPNPVSPGDTMTASIAHTGGTWDIVLSDSTKGWTFDSSTDLSGTLQTNVEQYSGPASSAEAIEEAPYESNVLPLADFGTAKFTSWSFTDSNASAAVPGAIDMVNGYDNTGEVIATPGTTYNSTNGSFTVTYQTPLPTIVVSISPAGGPTGGGTTVSIEGFYFDGFSAVQFGTAAASTPALTANTSNQIYEILSARSPPEAAGTVPVTVTRGPRSSSPVSTINVQYTFAAPPALTGIAPASGPTAGGTSVTITGSDLTGGAVSFGSSPAAGSCGATSCTVTAPAASAGPVGVTVTTFGGKTNGETFTYAAPPPPPASGYDLVGSDGGVFVFPPPGTNTGFYGSLPGLHVSVNDIVGMVPTYNDQGYFLVGSDGGVFAFGNAPFLGSLPGLHVTPSQPITGIVPTSNDQGYFLVGRDGGVFAFGNAPFLGSLPGEGIHVNDIIGIAATASGQGYWLVAANGTVYAFGDAQQLGSATGTGSPVTAIAGTPDGGGYWIVTANGSVYSFGDAGYFGSLPQLGVTPALPVIGVVHTADDGGYWLIGADGGIFAFGDAPFVGSLPGLGVHVSDIVGAVPTQS